MKLSNKENQAIQIFFDVVKYLEKWNNNLTIVPSDKKYYRIILNLIDKLLEENNHLQREKEENKFIIAMANNEMLGYNQGYSDGKAHNSNATEIIVMNREDYIYKQEIKCYKSKIEFLNKQIELMSKEIFRNFKDKLIIEYGIENEEQFKRIFEQRIMEEGEINGL